MTYSEDFIKGWLAARLMYQMQYRVDPWPPGYNPVPQPTPTPPDSGDDCHCEPVHSDKPKKARKGK